MASRTVVTMVVLFIFTVLIFICGYVITQVFPKGNWLDRATLVAAIIGLYGSTIGIFSKTKARTFLDLDDLASSNVLKFLRANLLVFTLIFAKFSNIFTSQRPRKEYSNIARAVGIFLWLILTPLVFLVPLIQLMIIVPISYLPIAIGSSMVIAFANSGAAIVIEKGGEKHSPGELIKIDQLAATGYLVGVPALILSGASIFLQPFI